MASHRIPSRGTSAYIHRGQDLTTDGARNYRGRAGRKPRSSLRTVRRRRQATDPALDTGTQNQGPEDSQEPVQIQLSLARFTRIAVFTSFAIVSAVDPHIFQ